MSVINLQTRVTVPQAFVTKGRQRVKQFSGYGNGSVYLRNGDEFEIELFNPTTIKILAKIKLNGKYISSSGIVLRPGERVFLERYLDEARKFLFETYEVDANDPNAREAIRNNGDVEVEFYEQYQPSQYTITYNPSIWTCPCPSWWTYTGGTTGGGVYTNSQGNQGTVRTQGLSSAKGMSGSSRVESIMYCNSSEDNALINDANAIQGSFPEYIPQETGRVEKGDNSYQAFTADSTTFNSYYTWKSSWKILPESQRPFVREDLAVYCTSCGAKRKKSTHKFCPNCGAKF